MTPQGNALLAYHNWLHAIMSLEHLTREERKSLVSSIHNTNELDHHVRGWIVDIINHLEQ
jgi:hypothetical protein